MAKVLVIRKPDRTIHQVPITNKAALMAFNNRLPDGQKWAFETMDEDEAAKLPAIDKNYVTAGEAVTKLKATEAQLSEKDTRIAELEKMLAGLNGGDKREEGKITETAVDAIAKINASTDKTEVEFYLADTRKTVQDAATKKIESFK